MLNQTKIAPPRVVELLGELHPLMSQLGSSDGLVTLSAVSQALRLPRIETRAALRSFLAAYRGQLLLPLELSAICRAFEHASRHEIRELIALDQEISRQTLLQALSSASQRVGKSQLERLKPLRDERVVQRYLRAVKEGRAHGWHTLVFGLTLSLYSLPVRQGLMTYARQILQGFIQVAARPLRLSKAECQEYLAEELKEMPRCLEEIVSQSQMNCGQKD